MTYAVRLEQFEGPLELLLSLIEKEKLDITRVSLAQVADQYLEYLKQDRSLPLGHLAQFLSIAARLILLKSKALLPLLVFTDDEEESIVDLEWQLTEYRRFREASLVLGGLLRQGNRAFIRERSIAPSTVVFFPPQSLEATDLATAFERIVGELSIQETLEEVTVESVVRLEEKMASFRATLSERLETSFRDLTQGVENRVELIVSFLALLQLMKERLVVAEQADFFGDIAIRRTKHE